MIGAFGGKVFQVSSQMVSTFADLSLDTAIDTENTSVDGSKPKTNVKGLKLDSMSFSITLSDRWINVRDELEAWRKLCESGIPQIFVIGGSPLGDNKWLLLSASAKDFNIDGTGKMRRAVLDLSFQEYVAGKAADKNAVKKTVTTRKSTPAVVAVSNTPKDFEDKMRINVNVDRSVKKGTVTASSVTKKDPIYVLRKDA